MIFMHLYNSNSILIIFVKEKQCWGKTVNDLLIVCTVDNYQYKSLKKVHIIHSIFFSTHSFIVLAISEYVRILKFLRKRFL